MKPQRLAIILSLILATALHAGQIHELKYLEEIKSARNFSQYYWGLGVGHSQEGGDIQTTIQGDEAFRPIPNTSFPQITVGGLYFWGKADLFLTLNLPVEATVSDADSIVWSQGIEIGGKYYIYQLKPYKITPYIGAAWAIQRLKVKNNTGGGDGADQSFHSFPLFLGGVYMTKYGLFDAGLKIQTGNSVDYYTSRTEDESIDLPPSALILSYKRFFKTETAYLAPESFMETVDRPAQKSTLTLGVGPAIATRLESSAYNESEREFFKEGDNRMFSPQLSIGYHIDKWEMAINMVYRLYRQKFDGFGVKQKQTRQSMSIDFIKYFKKESGFIPFIGFGISDETLHVKEKEEGLIIYEETEHNFAPTFITGIEIRPTPYSMWTIRSMLRYTPQNEIKISNHAVNFNDLELTIFEFVMYPWRKYAKPQSPSS